MSADETDLLLVKRVQEGDKNAFNVLVQKYQHKMASLVSRYVSSPGDIADVTQEAFIKAYKALPNFRGESAFYTWLYRITVNTAKNHLVAAGRRPPSKDIDIQDAAYIDGSEHLKEGTSPESSLMADQLRAVVFETIDSLPDELSTAISLREIEGMSYEEIAAIMGCPVGTVRSRIFRAREAIDQKLKPLLKRE